MPNPFTEHPHAVGETYLEHFRASAGFGVRLLTAAVASFAHAAVPFVCTRTGSRIVGELHAALSRRGAPVAGAAPPDRPTRSEVPRGSPSHASVAPPPPAPCPRTDLII